MSKASIPPFHSLFERVGLPYWLGALLTGTVPLSILISVDYLFSPFDLVTFPDLLIGLSLFSTYLLLATRFASKKLEDLARYAGSMILTDPAPTMKTSPKHTFLGSLWVWLGFVAMFTLLAGIPTGQVFFEEHVASIAYFLLILSYFIWSYAYSMLTVYRLGKLPLRLKPYTMDRTLGLRPFGVASLQLTSAYVAFPFVIVLTSLLFGNLQLTDIVIVTSMIVAGGFLFFLPLLSIRDKLRKAKREELNWIIPWHTRVVEQLKLNGEAPNKDSRPGDPQKIAEEFQLVRSIHQDIRQIQTWPFDVGILTRLVTILVLPPLLGVVARLLVLLFLHI